MGKFDQDRDDAVADIAEDGWTCTITKDAVTVDLPFIVSEFTSVERQGELFQPGDAKIIIPAKGLTFAIDNYCTITLHNQPDVVPVFPTGVPLQIVVPNAVGPSNEAIIYELHVRGQ